MDGRPGQRHATAMRSTFAAQIAGLRADMRTSTTVLVPPHGHPFRTPPHMPCTIELVMRSDGEPFKFVALQVTGSPSGTGSKVLDPRSRPS